MNENSFLTENEDIRTSYLIVVASAATADRQNTQEEIAFVEQMALAANLSDENRSAVTNAVKDASSTDVASHVAKFKDNDLKFSLVTDLLNLSYADGKLSDTEVAEIQKINSALGISTEQFDALKQYVEASNKEASKEGGNPLITAEGQPKAQTGNFLEKIGLAPVFQKLGIPTNNFVSGATIAVTLTTAAYFLISNYMQSGKAQPQEQVQEQVQVNSSSPLMSFLGTALTGVMASQAGGQGQQGGLMGMVAGLVGSQGGQAAIGNVLSSVTQSFSKGNGVGNLMNIIGGLASATQGQPQQGQPQQNNLATNLTNLFSAFMK